MSIRSTLTYINIIIFLAGHAQVFNRKTSRLKAGLWITNASALACHQGKAAVLPSDFEWLRWVFISAMMSYPLWCSIYGISTNICPKNDPNVGKSYSIHGAYGIGQNMGVQVSGLIYRKKCILLLCLMGVTLLMTSRKRTSTFPDFAHALHF